MSKTIETYVVKATMLAEGMKKHLNELSVHGVNGEELDSLIAMGEDVVQRGREVDELRMKVNEKAHEANIRLLAVKDKCKELKAILKKTYPVEEWHRFGLMDKR